MTGFFIVHCYFIENNFPRAVDHRPKGPGWGAVGVTLLHTVTVYAGLSGFISEKAGIVACGISPEIIVGQAKVSTKDAPHTNFAGFPASASAHLSQTLTGILFFVTSN